MRRAFIVPPLGIGIIQELANEAKLWVSRNDLIQLEVVGENVQDHISVTIVDEGRNILPVFEGLLDCSQTMTLLYVAVVSQIQI